MSMIVLKGQRMSDIVALAKGLIGPTDLANGGELTAQGAEKLISMLFEDKFLAKITTERMKRLTKDVDVVDMQRRRLVRVPEGDEASNGDLTSASEHGAKLIALEAQLFAFVKKSFLRENADNPQLLKLVEKMFQTLLGNDLVELGFVGVSDDGVGADRDAKFLRLNKGWLQIARDADAAQKLNIDPATDNWVPTLSAIVDAADARWKGDSVLLMNPKDADAYSREINAPVTGHETATMAPANSFEGKPIERHASMPEGSVLFTPLKNLVFGAHTDVQRSREYKNAKRGIEYVFDMSFDYEIAVKQAVVLGE